MSSEKLFQLWGISPKGKEFKIGTPDTEKRCDNFRKAYLGCIGEQLGYRYVVRPV